MNPKSISIDSYDYTLPDCRIASHPLPQRDSCKLLYLDAQGNIGDYVFKDISGLIPSGSIMIYNDTRVIRARLKFRRATGGEIEIFCLEPFEPSDYALAFATRNSCRWCCLVGKAKRWKKGEYVYGEAQMPDGTVCEVKALMIDRDEAHFIIQFQWPGDYSFADVIASMGKIPIPPYLNRESEKSDETDYQTVYACHNGSVAAPTAGLHFTEDTLKNLSENGIEKRRVTLHVGAGTFRPVKSETLEGHDMHAEFISVPLDLIKELATTDKKIYAVGTTTVRTLESIYLAGCMVSKGLNPDVIPQWWAYDPDTPRLSRKDALNALASCLEKRGEDTFTADTRIIIAPSYQYRIIDGLITNFHQPKSTLLLLVSALIGDKWHEAYKHALDNGYRFLSYGDACLFERTI